jgi:hypothetical protein
VGHKFWALKAFWEAREVLNLGGLHEFATDFDGAGY